MESPRLAQEGPVDLPVETSDHANNLVSEIPAVDPAKISQDSDINNAKAINQENSRIPPESSHDGQDLSETTKSDRKSTGEAEETQSQQAQQVKVEEDGAEKRKSSDYEILENVPEIREAEEAVTEVNQISEAQENISQENVENKEINKSEPEIKEPEVQQNIEAQIEKEEEPKIESDNIVQDVVEKTEVIEAEKVNDDVEEKNIEVKEEPVVVESTEAQIEEKPVDIVVENQVQEESSQVQEVSESEQKVENIEEVSVAQEVVIENKVEEEPVVEAENQPEEQNNNEIAPVIEEAAAIVGEQVVIEKKVEEEPIAQAEEIIENPVQEEPAIEAENKPEEQNNTEVIPVTEEAAVVVETKSEEQAAPVSEEVVAEKKEEEPAVVEIQPEEQVAAVIEEKVEETVVKAENKPEEQNNEVIQVSEEVVVEKKVEEEPVIQAEKKEESVKVEENDKKEGMYTFPVEEVQKESNPVATVEPPVKEEEEAEKKVEEPVKEQRSPKIKGLKLNIQNNVMTRIINYGSDGQPIPDASLAQEKKENISEESKNDSNGSPEVKKDYPSNQSLTDLLKPINMEEPQASPVIKRMATSTTCLAQPEESKEKEPQQPNSAMITSTQKQKLTLDDFQKITSLGRGSYGEVFLVKKIANNKLYALKSIDKNFMKKEKKEHQVFVEREVLMKLNHPNIIKLVSSFQDKLKLYFVLEYVSGGEFSDYLRVNGKLTKEQIVFFSAEIINILEYLHNFGIAHRDMKPENLLLTADGHIKCIDFGTARFLANDKRTADLYNMKKGEDTVESSSTQKKNHRSTFVGTAQYVSPEMLEGSDCGAPADLWALGCMIYLMAVGRFPFIDINEYLIFQKIKAASVVYPEDMDAEIKDIIQKLLVKEPNRRLGAGEEGLGTDYPALRGHPLFKGIDFATLNEQKPPVVEIASPHKKKQSHDLHPTGPSVVSQKDRKVNSEDLTQPGKTSQAFNFQTDNQVKVILSGLVLKKCGWFFYKPRQLILNNKPRLLYYDPDTNQLKGEIPLAPTTKAELESQSKFTVTCPNKKFVFKEMEHSAERWVAIINDTIAQLYAKKADQ